MIEDKQKFYRKGIESIGFIARQLIANSENKSLTLDRIMKDVEVWENPEDISN
jgi:hypothetical protein